MVSFQTFIPLKIKNSTGSSRSFGKFTLLILSIFSLILESEASTPTLTLKKIESDLKDFQTHFPNEFKIEMLGKTKLQNSLLGIVIESSSDKKRSPRYNPQTILLSGGMHGNEYLGFEHLLGELFLKPKSKKEPLTELQRFIQKGGRVLFVPLLNPDGFVEKTRTNSEKKDLNRFFKLSKSPDSKPIEVSLIENWIESKFSHPSHEDFPSKNLLFSIDYHCCKKALLYPNAFINIQQRSIAKESSTLQSKMNQNLQSLSTLFPKIFGMHFRTGFTEKLLGYKANGTIKDYLFEKYQTLSFTFEGEETNSDFKENQKKALIDQEKLISTLLHKQMTPDIAE